LLSPRKVAELKWNRTINTAGRIGHNIPCDMYIEHLNRTVENLGSNINKQQCLEMIGKCLGTVKHICTRFENGADVHENKDYHTVPSFTKDLKLVIGTLLDNQVFKHEQSQPLMITSYKKAPMFWSINWESLLSWVKDKIIDLDI